MFERIKAQEKFLILQELRKYCSHESFLRELPVDGLQAAKR